VLLLTLGELPAAPHCRHTAPPGGSDCCCW
jgi:hypothetical protein